MAGKYELYPFKTGEILTLKKNHPCGNSIWTVERVGQEIGIRCQKCGHFLLIPRRTLEKSIKEIKEIKESKGIKGIKGVKETQEKPGKIS